MDKELAKPRNSHSYRFIKILDRMIAWDLLKTLSAVLSVLVIIIVSRKFIKILALAIEGTISGSTAIDIFGLKTIVVIVNFLPAAVFMAVLMVLGRMYRDQEMSAIASAGGGAGTLYRAVFLLMIPLSAVTAGLSLYAAPWAEEQMLLLTTKDMETADLRGISAGRFTEYSHGDLVFYTEEIDSHLRMHNIFIQDRQHGRLNIVSAKLGRLKELPTGKYVVMEKGQRNQGTPGSGDFILEAFDEYAVRIDKKTNPVSYEQDAIHTEVLLKSEKTIDQVELQKRLSSPLSVLLLSFLAVPLAKLSPRGGVYGNLMFAFLVYFIYGNINQLNYSWVSNNVIPIWLGYIWVYLFLMLVAISMLIKVYGVSWMFQTIKAGKNL